jgi:ATP-binding protein involved in chromosome partitioning
MFLSEAINVPVLGIIENMAFTPEELPDNKYYLLEKSENLAEDLGFHFLEEYPLYNPYVKLRLRSSCSDANSIWWRTFDEVTCMLKKR